MKLCLSIENYCIHDYVIIAPLIKLASYTQTQDRLFQTERRMMKRFLMRFTIPQGVDKPQSVAETTITILSAHLESAHDILGNMTASYYYMIL